jgi:hypothetical protein
MFVMRRLWLAAAFVSVACASNPIRKQDAAALAEADARVLEGCYDCLIEARTTYARVAVGKARPLVAPRLFEVELLLALREMELAIDASASFARARALAKELPPALEADRYVSIAEAVPPDTVGTPFAESRVIQQRYREYVPRIDDDLAWLDGGLLRQPVREYLKLALDCGYPARPVRPGQPPRQFGAPAVPPGAPPLIAYQVAICRALADQVLQKVRADVPRFTEAAYFLARLEVANAQNTGGAKARALLDEAYQRFPQSPSVTYLAGNFHQLIGDCRAGLRYYDETLALRAVHEQALLGRTICLSFLKRSDEAIATATLMIDLKTFNTAEAYYWRAWNRHLRTELVPARADIDSAKKMARNLRYSTLAGIIEHDQDDLDPADRDLRDARVGADGRANCTAMWYHGLVFMKRAEWLTSAGHFEAAQACYEIKVAQSEAGLRVMEARTDLEPEFRARQIAGFQAAIKEDRSQYFAAAFNAANHHARGGNVARARELVEVAAGDPALAERVKQLRDILKDS